METKRIAALHDLSGIGRCSLTMVIPALSAMGICVCPVPTAVLSAHSGYETFIKKPLDGFLENTLNSYIEEGIIFHSVFSGYLGSSGQVKTVRSFMEKQSGLRVVDPVFADDGVIYPSISSDMVNGMRSLISVADVITPNLTEAAFLLSKTPVESLPRADERKWLFALRAMGPRNVLITSCRREKEENCVCVLGADEEGGMFRVRGPYLPASFQGNGDLFGAVLVGGLLNGLPLREAARQAAGFICAAMEEALAAQSLPIEGVRLERLLPLLITPPQYQSVTIEEI